MWLTVGIENIVVCDLELFDPTQQISEGLADELLNQRWSIDDESSGIHENADGQT